MDDLVAILFLVWFLGAAWQTARCHDDGFESKAKCTILSIIWPVAVLYALGRRRQR